jgi:hypothetical protein
VDFYFELDKGDCTATRRALPHLVRASGLRFDKVGLRPDLKGLSLDREDVDEEASASRSPSGTIQVQAHPSVSGCFEVLTDSIWSIYRFDAS